MSKINSIVPRGSDDFRIADFVREVETPLREDRTLEVVREKLNNLREPQIEWLLGISYPESNAVTLNTHKFFDDVLYIPEALSRLHDTLLSKVANDIEKNKIDETLKFLTKTFENMLTIVEAIKICRSSDDLLANHKSDSILSSPRYFSEQTVKEGEEEEEEEEEEEDGVIYEYIQFLYLRLAGSTSELTSTPKITHENISSDLRPLELVMEDCYAFGLFLSEVREYFFEVSREANKFGSLVTNEDFQKHIRHLRSLVNAMDEKDSEGSVSIPFGNQVIKTGKSFLQTFLNRWFSDDSEELLALFDSKIYENAASTVYDVMASIADLHEKALDKHHGFLSSGPRI